MKTTVALAIIINFGNNLYFFKGNPSLDPRSPEAMIFVLGAEIISVCYNTNEIGEEDKELNEFLKNSKTFMENQGLDEVTDITHPTIKKALNALATEFYEESQASEHPLHTMMYVRMVISIETLLNHITQMGKAEAKIFRNLEVE